MHADFDHVTGAGLLRVDVAGDARVLVPELGIDVAAGETVAVERVEPWSAEIPRLYDVSVVGAGERVTVRIGFRRVAISDGLLHGQRAPRAVPRRQPARVRSAMRGAWCRRS